MARFWRKKSKPIAERIKEYHKDFAERIITQIKEGVAPWQKPWTPGEKFLPANFTSGNVYRGSNSLNLASVAVERGYSDHRWGTYRQIRAAGGFVRKGEKGTTILHVRWHDKKPVKDDEGRFVKDKDGKQVYQWVRRSTPGFKRHVVFNVQQADRLKLPALPEGRAAWEAHDAAERVIRASGVEFHHERGDSAKYQPGADRIVMPPREQFSDAGSYYRTALHELAHATGHEDRMNRESFKDAVSAGFGSPAYAKEELRAEISSMMTNTKLGIGHEPRHGAAYVGSWVQALEEHPREIAEAAAEAQAMSAYMIARGRDLAEREAQVESSPEPLDSGAGEMSRAVPVSVSRTAGGARSSSMDDDALSRSAALRQLSQAGIECRPAEGAGWHCTESSTRGYLGLFSSPGAAAQTLTGPGAGRPQVIRNAHNTAVIAPPRVGGARSYWRVRMGKDGWSGSLEARTGTAKAAEILAQRFAENGQAPRGAHYRDQPVGEFVEKHKAQGKSTAADSREPEIQHHKTDPERVEYRQGERTATITRPDTQAGGTERHRRHTEQHHYLVTMETRGGFGGKLTAWAKDSDDAHEKARRYTATGVTPTWSERHPDTAGPRHQTPGPTPEPTRSRTRVRDEGPSR